MPAIAPPLRPPLVVAVGPLTIPVAVADIAGVNAAVEDVTKGRVAGPYVVVGLYEFHVVVWAYP